MNRRDTILAGTWAENTHASYIKDLGYFWAWMEIKHIQPEDYPVEPAMIEDFVLDHLHGLPAEVEAAMVAGGFKRPGKHRAVTVHRRVNAVVWAHKVRNLPNPVRTLDLRRYFEAAKRGETKAGITAKKSRPIGKAILDKMLRKCGTSLEDKRDAAILVFGFYSGGRRRSEIAAADMSNLHKVRGGYEYIMPRSKTDQAGKGKLLMLREPNARHLTAWIYAAGIDEGPIFRKIRAGIVAPDAIDPSEINMMIKYRVELAGENPKYYSSHGLRRGFITECGRLGISIQDAMQMSGHKDIRTAFGYHQEGEISRNPGTKI